MGARVRKGCAVPIARVRQTYYAAVFLTVAGKVRLLASCITCLIDFLGNDTEHRLEQHIFLHCFCVTKQNIVVLINKKCILNIAERFKNEHIIKKKEIFCLPFQSFPL